MKGLVYIWCMLCSVVVLGQDIHFTQYGNSPLISNPALTGNHQALFRAVANYRNQWAANSLVPYNTFALGGDMRAWHDVRSGDRMGVGAYFYNDRAGDSRLNTFEFSVSTSFVKAIKQGRHIKHSIAVGGRLGVVQSKIDLSDLEFDNRFVDGLYNPSIPNNEELEYNSFTYGDVAMGFMYKGFPERDVQYEIGFSIDHLNTPVLSFNDDAESALQPLIGLHLRAQFPMGESWFVIPEFFASKQEKKAEALFGVMFNKYFKAETRDPIVLIGGAHYRYGDAPVASMGGAIRNWKMVVSYDINISDLRTVSRKYGGTEVSLIYRFLDVPDLSYKGAICPVF